MGWVVSFTPWPLYSQGKSDCHPLDRKLGGPQNRSGRGSGERNSHPLPVLELPIIQPVAQRCTDWAIPAPLCVSGITLQRLGISTVLTWGAEWFGWGEASHRKGYVTGRRVNHVKMKQRFESLSHTCDIQIQSRGGRTYVLLRPYGEYTSSSKV